MTVVRSPWAAPVETVVAELGSGLAGLTGAEARRRLVRYGHNVLRAQKRRSAWRILAMQFESVLVLVLVAAGVAAFAFGRGMEGAAVAAVIVVNASIGFVMELRAVRSMEALRTFAQAEATVRRAGQLERVPARDLVVGDIVVVESGDVVTSDLRIVEASKLEANESTLTGESLPVPKSAAVVSEGTPLAERRDMLFKGTVITRGSGEGIVVGTGMCTELGRIAELVAEAEDEETPLEQRLDRLGKRLVWLTAVIALIVAASGFAAGRNWLLVIETAIALAVSTVPEGLPIVATLALARGMRRMARRHALVRRLSAVETLGSTSVLLTDKTGTLTENRMTLVRVVVDGGAADLSEVSADEPGRLRPAGALVERALRLGALCNNADLRDDAAHAQTGVGDPLEVALLLAARRFGIEREALVVEAPELREEPFDPEIKMMATFHGRPGDIRVAVKGAPEAVLDVCTRVVGDGRGGRDLSPEARRQWLEENRRMAEDGLRVLAVAERHAQSASERPYRDLTLVGLLGLLDPPREDAREVVEACRAARIRVVMVTGDQADTAERVARSVGLMHGDSVLILSSEKPEDDASRRRVIDAEVVARASPRQKLAVLDAHQSTGAVVAMVGDGVNDAPALKKADIGVAMGRRGTQVAREAADMVLQDDSLGTVVAAVEQGRVIFDNIRNFVLYLLSCNVSELLSVGVASVLALPLPVLPLQILFLNLVTDVFPALALGFGEGEKDVGRRSPRPLHEPVIGSRHWWAIAGYGVVLMVAVLASLVFSIAVLECSRLEAVTVSFLTLGFAQTIHVFNMRRADASSWNNEITNNPWVWGAVALCSGLMLAAVYLPGLSHALQTRAPSARAWLAVVGFSALPLVVGQGAKIGRRLRGGPRPSI